MRDKHSSMYQETQNGLEIPPNSLGYQAHTQNWGAELSGFMVQGGLDWAK